MPQRSPTILPGQLRRLAAPTVQWQYRWRPNLADEGANHVLELAVAAGDAPIVTFNRRDFRGGELRFPSIVVQTPGAWLTSQGFS
jgi:hypothetical protein